MKLRNKLVAVLAASMVVTSVPVVTMADTTNHLSTERYAQKGTTFGYLTDKYGAYDVVYGNTDDGIGGSKPQDGYSCNFSNSFEFTPVSTYNTTDTTYFSLTADSDFNAKAIITYVDAFYAPNGISHLAFDGDTIVNANNPEFNGEKADELLKKGVYMCYNGYSATSRMATPTARIATLPTLVSGDVATEVHDTMKVKVNAAGNSLYKSAVDFDTFMQEVENQICEKIETAVGKGTTPSLADGADIIKAAEKKTGVDLSKVVTTSYSELYKAAGDEINGDKLAEIINETAQEVTQKLKDKPAYKDAYKAVFNAARTKLKIQLVNVSNFKDANDREFKSHMEVTSTGEFVKDITYKIPILAKLGGDKQVLLNVDGKDSNITSSVHPLTQDTLTDKRLKVTAGSEKVRTNDTDKIGEITFTESQIQSLTKEGKNRKIKIVLPKNSDLEFNLNKTKTEMKVTGKRGFSDVDVNSNGTYDKDVDGQIKGATVADDILTSNTVSEAKDVVRIAYGKTSTRKAYSDTDRQTLVVELPAWADDTAVGEVVLSDIYVQPVDDVAKVGDVEATISEYIVDGEKSTNLLESKTLKVAEVKDYDVTLTCDKSASIKAGRSGIVNDNKATFVLEEMIKDSLVDSRKIKFTLENGYIFGPADVYDDVDAANAVTTGLYGTTKYKNEATEVFKKYITQEKIKFEEKAGDDGDDKGIDLDSIALDIDMDGRVVGFSATYPRLKNDNADKIKVTIPVATDVMSKGEVKVKAENLYTRSFQDKDEDPSCVIANVVEPIAVTFDGAKLKVGKQAQEAGTITIKETDKGMLEKGWLFLNADHQNGITFDTEPTVKVEGTDGKALVVKNVAISKDRTMMGIEITRESSEASTIVISDIKMTADRTVPEANYDLAIWGKALTDENELGISNFTQNALYNYTYFNQTSDLYLVKDFVQMTTVNTEDLIGAPKAVTTQFVIGQKSFTVNGETKSMEAAPYIKDGLTFVPVRYLAEAFGVTGTAVQYDKATSTVTIIYGDKAVKMTNGKAVMTVNGTEIPMQVKAEIGKDGRMYVPMAYIASAFGVEKSWDATTKTATFTNQR